MANPFKTAGATTTKDAPASKPAMTRPESSTKAEEKTAPKKDPFARPTGGGDGARIKDDLGSLLVLRPTEFLENFTTSVGSGDVIRADWLVCDGENAGEIREGALIFNAPLVRDLKRAVGGLFVGRLEMGQKEIKGNKPFIFVDYSDEEEALARECAESVGWI